MYVLRNSFGTTQVFGTLEIALDAYEKACLFCEFVGLYNAYTGEAIAESW